ncbi:hypothetical protein RYX36_033012 [Vicia faba]
MIIRSPEPKVKILVDPEVKILIWRASGITSELQLYCTAIGALVFAALMLFAGWFHYHKAAPKLAWFQDVESMLNHHLAGLLGLGSLSWAGHQVHVSLPINQFLNAGVDPKEIPLPHEFILNRDLLAQLYPSFAEGATHFFTLNWSKYADFLTFRGGLDPLTGGLWLTDIAHHHLAIAILFLIAGHMYRTNWGIGHGIKDILEAIKVHLQARVIKEETLPRVRLPLMGGFAISYGRRHPAWQGNFEAWVQDPLHVRPIAHAIWDPHFGQPAVEAFTRGGALGPVNIAYSGVYQWWIQRRICRWNNFLSVLPHPQGLGPLLTGVITSLVAQHMYSLPAYAFIAQDFTTQAALYTHHQYIAGFIMTGAFAHGAIFFIRDYNPEQNEDNVLARMLEHKEAIISHLSWASLFLGFHTLGLYVHNDVMLAFGTPEKQILIEPIFAQWIQSAHGKTSYGFDVLLSSTNSPALNAGRSIWLPGWLNAINENSNSLFLTIGPGDFLVHHAIALGLHTTTLILVKGALDARGSKLMPDKKDFGYSFPCDGPGRGGTCDISAWDAFYLAVFWMLNTIGWELIETLAWAHERTPLANLIRWRDKPVALSIVQARLVGLVHFSVGYIFTYAAFLIASTSGKFG